MSWIKPKGGDGARQAAWVYGEHMTGAEGKDKSTVDRAAMAAREDQRDRRRQS